MDLVKLFYEIRDVPYKISLSVNEAEDFSCSGKCIKLKKILEKLGYKVNYRVCDFLRSDLKLSKDIFDCNYIDLSMHVYLEVFIDDKFVILDPTWDLGLKDILPVNDWDGISDTQIAVKPTKLYSFSESNKIMNCFDKDEIQKDLDDNYDFYLKLNNLFDIIRMSSN